MIRPLRCALAAALALTLAAVAGAADKGPVDLRAMSATMAFATVSNMANDPEKYVGLTVRMSGTFMTFELGPGREKATACVIKDATACCAAGLEFSLAQKPKSPLREGAAIAVEGVFTIEKEAGMDFAILKNARLLSR